MKKFLTLLVLATSLSAFTDEAPNTKNFIEKKTRNKTEVGMCIWNQGGCDSDVIEADLTEECYQKGFQNCTTIKKETIVKYKGSDIFCGSKQQQTCFVIVQGKN